MPTQAPPGVPSLEAAAKAYLKEKYHKPSNVYLGVPHRLDRPVSGIVLFARNSKAASRLAEQFQNRQVKKIYWVIVEGTPMPSSGTFEDYIRKIPDHAKAEIASSDTPDAKLARLHYHVLRTGPDWTHVEIELETGRMHQIRVQMASRGWPVLGDVTYGSTRTFGPHAEECERVIALHAGRLTFLHPLSYQPTTLATEPPEYWRLYLAE